MSSPSADKVARTDAGLASTLRIAVATLSRRLRAERDPHNELSVGALSVLATLLREGDQSIGALAAHERVQPPSMTRTVTFLEDEGYVVRRQHETDRRQVVVAVAPKGAETMQADRRRRDVWLAQRLRELSHEERALLRQAAPILEKLGRS